MIEATVDLHGTAMQACRTCKAWHAISGQKCGASILLTSAVSTFARLQEADLVRLRREAKKSKGFFVEDEPKVVFVVRIRGINDMHPKVGTFLRLLSRTSWTLSCGVLLWQDAFMEQLCRILR